MATFDIVIPTLDSLKAHRTVQNLKYYSQYAHNYIIVDNGDAPTGYVEPCNRGLKAGNSDIICFVNDDILVTKKYWDIPLLEEAQKGTYCFGPWTEAEDRMKLNGWFLCLRRDYIEHYGYAFDPRYVVWCGDIDLLKRLEADSIEPVLVKGIDISHTYGETASRSDLQRWIVPHQLQDIATYKQQWGSDPNHDKLRS